MDEVKIEEKLNNLLKDFDYTPKYQVDVMGKKIDVPVKYSNVRAFMFFFPISIEMARKLINNKRLEAVSILKKKCLLGITIFDYIECPVEPYREVALSIPVILDSKISIPFLPLIFDFLFKKFGFYTILLAMNNDIARKHSEIIFGYPTYDKNINIDIKEESNGYTLISASEGSEKILSIGIKKGSGNLRRIRKKSNTYFIKDDKIFNAELNYAAYELAEKNGSAIDLGNHKISRIIKNLLFQNKPLRSIYYAKAIEILYSPKEV